MKDDLVQRIAHLDLVWDGQVMGTETVMNWEMDPMRLGAQSTPLSVRDVVERHGGAFWFERERVHHEAFFSLAVAAGHRAGGARNARDGRRSRAAWVLRLRPLQDVGPGTRPGRPPPDRAFLHRVRHRNHRA
jgi:hypothetical protein